VRDFAGNELLLYPLEVKVTCVTEELGSVAHVADVNFVALEDL